MTETRMHRHIFKMISLAEFTALPFDRWGNRIVPFVFCDICGCVPDNFVGYGDKTAEGAKANDRRSNQSSE